MTKTIETPHDNGDSSPESSGGVVLLIRTYRTFTRSHKDIRYSTRVSLQGLQCTVIDHLKQHIEKY